MHQKESKLLTDSRLRGPQNPPQTPPPHFNYNQPLNVEFRGIGNKLTQRHVYNTCHLNCVKFLALLEPKVDFEENFFV